MSILSDIKEKRETINKVKEAKQKKHKINVGEELEKEARELAKELGVTFDEALTYLRNEKNNEHKRKIAHERQERLTAKGKKILRGLENWGARAKPPPITQSRQQNTKSDLQQNPKSNIESDVEKPTEGKKQKNFFEICKDANK